MQVGDIDRERTVVHVHRGKGAKDCDVPLPSRTLTVLRQCWGTHRHPEWLFPAKGRDGQQAATADQLMPHSSLPKAMSREIDPVRGDPMRSRDSSPMGHPFSVAPLPGVR